MHSMETSSTTLDDDGYDDFLSRVRAQFAASASSKHLFKTDVTDLWDAYFDAAPPGERQVRTCATCRAFIERSADS